MKEIKKTVWYGTHQLTVSTGVLARQASGAVMVRLGDTMLLVTAVVSKQPHEGRDFFPLTVNYQERVYAAGRIPGGYFKREGRPSERETLTSRLIDRPIRPLFPEGFTNDVQVIATVMSLDPEVSPDIPAMIGASAALALSGAPFQGPIGAARVGYDAEGQYLLNPRLSSLSTSALDMVVAGTEGAVLMVESEAKELSEETMLGAVMFAHEQMQPIIQLINELADEGRKEPLNWVAPVLDQTLFDEIKQMVEGALGDAYLIREKPKRQECIAEIHQKTIGVLCTEERGYPIDIVKKLLGKIEKDIVRSRVLKGEPRVDGRETKTVRPIQVQTGLLPRAHGSAVFTRGETQAIVTATLGTVRDAQVIDALEGEFKDPFMLHYNFPPYSVGETGMVGSPKRREIGHGRLARRAIQAVLPSQNDFPYIMRIVSEITESNGSSSMASVCGSSLALMDAGVPIKAPVAGIAMGLIKESHGYTVLTDILGDEDHLGDMDFKVAGTQQGVTALQMDIKIDGITHDIMDTALQRARAARLHILSIMNEHLHASRADLSDYAPRLMSFKIPSGKIRDVIGKGGTTIRSITEETGVEINIEDDGTVCIAAVDGAAAEEARKRIDDIVLELGVGSIYEGKVVKIVDFGAFVRIAPGKEGLVHISQICEKRLGSVTDVLSEGEVVKVKVTEIDRQGRIRLSIKEAL